MHLSRLLVLTLALGACEPVPELPPGLPEAHLNQQIAFRVNGYPVYKEDYLRHLQQEEEETKWTYEQERNALLREGLGSEKTQLYLAKLEQQEESELNSLPQKVRDRLATLEVLYQKALDEGYLLDPPTLVELEQTAAVKLAWTKKTTVINLMSEAITSREVTDEDVAIWYRENKMRFGESMLDIRTLTIPDEALAVEIGQRLETGVPIEPFETLYGANEPGESSPPRTLTALRKMSKNDQDIFENAQVGDVIGPTQKAASSFVIQYVAHRELRIPTLEQLGEQALEEVQIARLNAIATEVKAHLRFSDDSTRSNLNAAEAQP